MDLQPNTPTTFSESACATGGLPSEPSQAPVDSSRSTLGECSAVSRSPRLENGIDGFPTCELSRSSDTIVSHQAISPSSNVRTGNWKFFGASVNQDLQTENQTDNVVEKMESGDLWVVNSRRRNGLIVLREFHAEFAGPGAAVGGGLDEGIVKVIPIGNLSLLSPDAHEAHQNAIKIRLQWIRLTQNFTDQPEPNDRARMILEQFKTYFDQATVDLVPDEAFAMLVGVLPQTIRRVRSGFVW